MVNDTVATFDHVDHSVCLSQRESGLDVSGCVLGIGPADLIACSNMCRLSSSVEQE